MTTGIERPDEPDLGVAVPPLEPLPPRAAELLLADGGLGAAVDRGAALLAVCAGMQILGHRFPDATAQVQAKYIGSLKNYSAATRDFLNYCNPK